MKEKQPELDLGGVDSANQGNEYFDPPNDIENIHHLESVDPPVQGLKSVDRKVAIIGTASSSVDLAPWDDPTWEKWGLAWVEARWPKFTALFDVHPINEIRKGRVPENYEEKLNNLTIPVFLSHKNDKIPRAQPYPLMEVMDFVGGKRTVYQNGIYFMSSVAYMLAYAMYMGYDEIALFGVDMIDTDEYGFQRPNMEYLIGLGRGMGFKIAIPPESALVKGTHLYGYESMPKDGLIGEEDLRIRLKQIKEDHDKALAQVYTLDGAIQEVTSQIAYMTHIKRGSNIGSYARKA